MDKYWCRKLYCRGKIRMELNLNSNSTIFFDTAPFIYYFEDNPDYGQLIDQLLSSIYKNNSSFVTSYITYIELITKPKQLGRNDIVAKYRDYFTNSDNLSIYPLNLMVSRSRLKCRQNSARRLLSQICNPRK